MKITPTTRLWVVTDPTPHSTLPDILFPTTLDGLRLQFAGGLTMSDHPTVYDDEAAATEDAKNRLAVWRIAKQILLDRALPQGEPIQVTLRDGDGTLLFEGTVR